MSSVQHFLDGQATLITNLWQDQVPGVPPELVYRELMQEVEPMLRMTFLYSESGIHRNRDQRRATAGDQDIVFRYKERKRKLYEWTPKLAQVRDLVAQTTGWTSNKVTINHYTPQGIIVPHRDKDYITGFVPEHEFAIFSLGATRNIVFIRLEDGQPTDDVTHIPVSEGSLLIVSGKLDQTHLHGMYQEPNAEFQPNPNRLSLAFKMHHIKEEDNATTDN